MTMKLIGVIVHDENGRSNTHLNATSWSIEDGLLDLLESAAGGVVATYAYGTWRSVQYAFGEDDK